MSHISLLFQKVRCFFRRQNVINIDRLSDFCAKDGDDGRRSNTEIDGNAVSRRGRRRRRRRRNGLLRKTRLPQTVLHLQSFRQAWFRFSLGQLSKLERLPQPRRHRRLRRKESSSSPPPPGGRVPLAVRGGAIVHVSHRKRRHRER